MEYGCECYCDDGEPMECSTITFPKARHGNFKCVECDRPIAKGEKHEHIKGKYEGEWVSWRTCTGCQRLRDDLGCCDPLAEVVKECFGVDILWKGRKS